MLWGIGLVIIGLILIFYIAIYKISRNNKICKESKDSLFALYAFLGFICLALGGLIICHNSGRESIIKSELSEQDKAIIAYFHNERVPLNDAWWIDYPHQLEQVITDSYLKKIGIQMNWQSAIVALKQDCAVLYWPRFPKIDNLGQKTTQTQTK